MKYISMLRGINVGGRKKIKMAELREMYVALGFEDVNSYIQSGNVVFDYKKTKPAELEAQIKQAIQDTFGFDVPVRIRTADDFKHIINSHPFFDAEQELKLFHVTFLAEAPNTEALQSIADFQYKEDLFQIDGDKIHLYCPGGYGETKLSNNFFERKLKVSATTRNWKTVLKLYEMAIADCP